MGLVRLASEEKVAQMFIPARRTTQVRLFNFWRCLKGGGGVGPTQRQQILPADVRVIESL